MSLIRVAARKHHTYIHLVRTGINCQDLFKTFRLVSLIVVQGKMHQLSRTYRYSLPGLLKDFLSNRIRSSQRQQAEPQQDQNKRHDCLSMSHEYIIT